VVVAGTVEQEEAQGGGGVKALLVKMQSPRGEAEIHVCLSFVPLRYVCFTHSL